MVRRRSRTAVFSDKSVQQFIVQFSTVIDATLFSGPILVGLMPSKTTKT